MSSCEKREEDEYVQTHEATAPEPSCVSVKSNVSMNEPPKLSNGAMSSDPVTACKMSRFEKREEQDYVQTHEAASPEPSCVSVKTDVSMNERPKLSNEYSDTACKMSRFEKREEQNYVQTHDAASPEPSCVSVKTDVSMNEPPKLSNADSCLSMKSDTSMYQPLNFSDGAVTSDPKLALCNLTGQCCASLSSSLQSSNSLKELDLSHNNLNLGIEVLFDGLKSSHCQLNILRLAFCNLTDRCCKSLSLSLQSSNSSLSELDLSNNDLQDSGVKFLSDGLKSSHCHLNILRLSGCMVTEEGCCFLASALSSNPSHLRELDLSYNHPGQSLVKLLSDPKYKLNLDHEGEFRIKTGLQKYATVLTLDLNTVNTSLSLSENNRKVTNVREQQQYPNHPERFDELIHQVLCRESLSERCYWEVEWREWGINISVTYKGIKRRGRSDDCKFGYNEKSWSLICSDDTFTVCHNKKSTNMRVLSRRSNRIGVYLDWSAGILSFYSISDTHTLTHLHTLKTTFTEPLYAGFRVDYVGGSVSLCEMKQLPVTNNGES